MSHQEKILEQNRRRLVEAVERMQSGKTLVLAAGFAWNKANLAREAQMNKDTVVRKRADGRYVYPEANHAIEAGPGGPQAKASTKCQMRARIVELEDRVVRMTKQIAELSKMAAKK
jgi:uncharacterized coiled-coil protein SlyX